MNQPINDVSIPTASARLLPSLVRRLGALQLAVPVLMTLTVVLILATLVETQFGPDFASWYIYGSRWFAGLLALLGVNIFCAAAARYPWKRHQTGFVVTHAGLLILLAGALQSFLYGVDGEVILTEGEAAAAMRVAGRGQISAGWVDGKRRPPEHFSFEPGPVDWPAGKSAPLGDVNGVSVHLTRFIRHAKPADHWVADASRTGGPALKIQLQKKVQPPENGPASAYAELNTLPWLVDEKSFGGEVFSDGLRFQLQQAANQRMLEDFLQPPSRPMGKHGLLLAYLGDEAHKLVVDDALNERISLGDSGVTVTVDEFLPNARPERNGRFLSVDDRPQNPLLELRLSLPGDDAPLRQIVSALNPALNLDAVNGAPCPVRFRYLHPAIRPVPGVEFLQIADGRLYFRSSNGRQYLSSGVVEEGSVVDLPHARLTVAEILPYARRAVDFAAVDTSTKEAESSPSAVEVTIRSDSLTQSVWLWKGDSRYGTRNIVTPTGMLRLRFSEAQQPLGFVVRLQDFHREFNPGSVGHAAFSSVVTIRAAESATAEEHVISMNKPLRFGGLTLYQSDFQMTQFGHDVSILRAAYDPGRGLKYLGGLLVSLGIGTMFYMRAYFFRDVPQLFSARPWQYSKSKRLSRVGKGMAVWLITPVLIGVNAAVALAGPQQAGEMDWAPWQAIPVQHGGRHKPLDTLARQTLQLTRNRGSWRDPVTGERQQPVEFYLTLLFQWSGWDSATGDAVLRADARTDYLKLRPADRWDHAPLLRCDHAMLRSGLGLPSAGRFVSADELHSASIKDARTQNNVPFVKWAAQLAELDVSERSEFEEHGLQLAQRLWAYQNHRMGRSLEVLPVAGSSDKAWYSFAHLMFSDFNQDNDPSGRLREVQQLFRQIRAANIRGDAQLFNQLSNRLVSLLRSIGDKNGDYPSSSRIAWEVAYNRYAPFRVAWGMMLSAAVFLCFGWLTGRPLFRRGASVFYTASLLSMAIGFTLRIAIAGRPPVTNMYESVIYVGCCVAVLGLIFSRIYRRDVFLAVAAVVATFALILADNSPTVLDPSLRPLEPVLRSNFWLVTHVMTITLSYAAFALAAGIANVTLFHFLFGTGNRSTISTLTRFNYKILQLGVLLLASGIILGGVWADYSWGRFWGWDPKEVWALVALLGYVTLLHARFAGWVDQRGLAAMTAVCFCLVIMAWYGVNFVLGAGLHSYGFGGGGKKVVFSIVVLQLLYVGVSLLRSRASTTNEIDANSSVKATSLSGQSG